MAKTATPNLWGAARVAVRALREVITRELAEGHPLTATYDRHKARIPTSYERFRIHGAREITNTAGSRGGALASPACDRGSWRERRRRPVRCPSPAREAMAQLRGDKPVAGSPLPCPWKSQGGIGHGVLLKARREQSLWLF
jgi:hypothetical protein